MSGQPTPPEEYPDDGTFNELEQKREREAIQQELRAVFVCKICGMPKTHHRLYGYRCNNPEHTEMENELVLQGRISKFSLRKSGDKE